MCRHFIHDSIKESHTEYKKSYETLWRRGILMIFDFWPKSAQKCILGYFDKKYF